MRLAAWAAHTAALEGLTAWPRGQALEPLAQLLGGGHFALFQTQLMLNYCNRAWLYVYVLAVCMFAVHVHAVQLMDTHRNTWNTWGDSGWEMLVSLCAEMQCRHVSQELQGECLLISNMWPWTFVTSSQSGTCLSPVVRKSCEM